MAFTAVSRGLSSHGPAHKSDAVFSSQTFMEGQLHTIKRRKREIKVGEEGYGNVGLGSVGLLAIDTKLNNHDTLYYNGPPGCPR